MLDILRQECESLVNRRMSVSQFAMQRSVADSIEGVFVQHIVETASGFDTRKAPSKRSIEDVLLLQNDNKFYVDIKSKDINAKFSMPNLISVRRLLKLYSNPNNHLIYVVVYYTHFDTDVRIAEIKVSYIESLDWDCLRIANLGTGQIQIRNANRPLRFQDYTREEWMNRLKTEYMSFCTKQIEAITKRKTWVFGQ